MERKSIGIITGEAFIAYIILMIFVGLPLFVLELSLGQFGQTGIIQLWRAVPFFKGKSYGQIQFVNYIGDFHTR